MLLSWCSQTVLRQYKFNQLALLNSSSNWTFDLLTVDDYLIVWSHNTWLSISQQILSNWQWRPSYLWLLRSFTPCRQIPDCNSKRHRSSYKVLKTQLNNVPQFLEAHATSSFLLPPFNLTLNHGWWVIYIFAFSDIVWPWFFFLARVKHFKFWLIYTEEIEQTSSLNMKKWKWQVAICTTWKIFNYKIKPISFLFSVVTSSALKALNPMDLLKPRNPHRVMLRMCLQMWSHLCGMKVMMYVLLKWWLTI